MKKILVALAAGVLSLNAHALTLKVGVLAPEGTTWSKNLKKMAKEIKEKTKKKVKIKFYFGGSQGDEHDVLRKIRVGQLHGGVFTGKTLSDINGDVRVVEVPFTFLHDRKKAWSTVTKMAPFFDKGFEKNKFTNLGFFEIGQVYFASTKKAENLKSLKGLKVWAWEGDKLVAAMIDTMKLVSVPLPLPDVLSSLSTGIIQAAYAPPLGIMSLQWSSKVKYVVDYPLSYSVGAFLISHKRWKKVKPEHQKLVREISKRYIDKVNTGNAGDNKESISAMKKMGIKFIEFPKTDIEQSKGYRKDLLKKLTGKVFSAQALKMLESHL